MWKKGFPFSAGSLLFFGDKKLCSKAFSTCGDFEVSAGTLDFMSNATWLKGTNVAVNGEGDFLAGGGMIVIRRKGILFSIR